MDGKTGDYSAKKSKSVGKEMFLCGKSAMVLKNQSLPAGTKGRKYPAILNPFQERNQVFVGIQLEFLAETRPCHGNAVEALVGDGRDFLG